MPWPINDVNTIRRESVTNALLQGVSFAALCREYGISRKTGYKWKQRALADGLSRLSAWWLALGIELDRSRPGHPQDSGAHERLHRDIAAELSRQRQPDAQQQEAAFDVWREQFNWERPHEALGGRCPGQIYRKSPRTVPAEIVLDYGVGLSPRKISKAGVLTYGRHKIFISGALAGWQIGLRACDHDRLELWFAHLLLGHIELSSGSFLRAASRPKEAPALLIA